MNANPNVKHGNAGIAIWHPTKAGGKNITGHVKDVPATHHCQTKPKAGHFKPGRIIGDYEFVDADGKKISTLDAGSQVMLEIGYNQADLQRAGNNTSSLVLAFWDEASGTWHKFTSHDHGFQLIVDSQKYPGFLGYGRVDKGVPNDPPTGWSP